MTDASLVAADNLPAWHGQSVPARTSPGGVPLLVDYQDALLRVDDVAWPPPALVTRLVADEEQPAKWPDDVRAALTKRLGFYCRLQSVNSEDAMTWSVFGPLAYGAAGDRLSFLHWLCERYSFPCQDRLCTVDLWRRIAHPHKPTASNGPELDAVLEGDQTIVFVEAKWGSPEGMNRGADGTAGQMQLRRDFLEKHGVRIYGERRFLVLGVVLAGAIEQDTPPDTSRVATRTIRWTEICGWEGHPRHGDLAAYLQWKLNYSTTRGTTAPPTRPPRGSSP